MFEEWWKDASLGSQEEEEEEGYRSRGQRTPCWTQRAISTRTGDIQAVAWEWMCCAQGARGGTREGARTWRPPRASKT